MTAASSGRVRREAGQRGTTMEAVNLAELIAYVTCLAILIFLWLQ
jgi:hypothetical protein